MAALLRQLGRLDEALSCLRDAISHDVTNTALHLEAGRLLAIMGDIDGAVAAFRRGVAVAPEDSYAHCLLAATLLAFRRFGEGWPEFEWRLRNDDFLRHRVEHLAAIAPRWDGGPVAGRTVLLAWEQGLGDTIQFVRYAPLVAAQGADVVVQCQAKLKPLLDGLAGVDAVIAEGEALPPVDLQATLPSLPFLLLDSLGETIPAAPAYLEVDAGLVEAWRQRLDRTPGLRVGISWKGSPQYGKDASRSIPLERFLPLAAVAGVSLFSLQGEDGLDQLCGLPDAAVHSLGPEIEGGPEGLLNTAAAIMALDLVICCDSAVAHLAGALGRPVWLLLCGESDWRWQRERDDSPWYPGMRLFRQRSDGDWEGVFREVGKALKERV